MESGALRAALEYMVHCVRHKAQPRISTIEDGYHAVRLAAAGFIKDARTYTELLSFPLRVVIDILNELGLEKSRIGFELGMNSGWESP